VQGNLHKLGFWHATFGWFAYFPGNGFWGYRTDTLSDFIWIIDPGRPRLCGVVTMRHGGFQTRRGTFAQPSGKENET